MNKIAIIGDIHFGILSDSVPFLDYQEKFFNDIFFPYLIKHNIKEVIATGDCWDRRKYVNFLVISRARKMFFDRLLELGINLKIPVGNHDVFYKNTNDVNSPHLLLSGYKNIHVMSEAEHVQYDGVKVAFIPWINIENHDSTMNFVKNSDADLCISHLELKDFPMGGSMKCAEGMDYKLFSHFPLVLSGHFHIKSQIDNVKYIGTAYEMTWNDEGDSKGFYTYDVDTKNLEFIPNPNKLHEKIFYNDASAEFMTYVKNIDFSYFTGKNVKLFVEKKTDKDLFEKFVENMYKIDMINFQIIEDISSFHELNIEVSIDATTSTGTLIENYIDNVETEMDKPRIKSMMNKLYLEALMETKE